MLISIEQWIILNECVNVMTNSIDKLIDLLVSIFEKNRRIADYIWDLAQR